MDAAVQFFKEKLGVMPIYGGYHKKQGTKNALINLNNECYLELLAVDNTNTAISTPRWMGVDELTKDKITRFALKSSDLKKDAEVLKYYDEKMGILSNGFRSTLEGSMLKWELTLPLASPEVEFVPFLIDWSIGDIHPSNYLPNMNCRLVKLYGTHPNPKKFIHLFEMLNFSMQIDKAKRTSLKMVIETPKGLVLL